MGGAQPPPSAKHRMGRQSVTRKALLLAKSCKDLLAQKLPKKMSGGVGGGAAPPICKTFNKMRTCRFLLSFARFCGNMSFPARLLGLACECGAINTSGGLGGAQPPPSAKHRIGRQSVTSC